MKRAVIFDMDGTLWDSVDEIVYSWNRTCPEMGIRREQLIGLMGKTMDCFAKELLPQYDFEHAMEIIHTCEREENEYLSIHGAVLYGDVRAVFEKLRDMGFHIGIVSNCQAGYIEVFLKYFGLDELVDDFECFGNTQQPKAENLTSLIERNGFDEFYYLGDTRGDYNACQKAGVPFVWAAYGFGTVDADVPRVNALEELPEWLRTNAGEPFKK